MSAVIPRGHVPLSVPLACVWGPEYLNEAHYLRVYMGQLRRKLEPEPANPRHLITVPGQGYRLEPGREAARPRR